MDHLPLALNKHLQKFKVEMDDVRIDAQIYNKGDLHLLFDLKSGYHDIEIEKS